MLSDRRTWIVIGVLLAITVTLALVVDADRDGLSNGAEWTHNSAMFDADTDDDGLCDGEGGHNCIDPVTSEHYGRGEGALFSSVFFNDSDADGLSDLEEARLAAASKEPFDARMAIRSPDSDDDTVRDGEEIAAGTNPYSADTDGDGLSDSDELRKTSGLEYASNATLADTDGDGLDDGTEILIHGTFPNERDSDGDGLSDAEEVKLGIGPMYEDSDRDRMPDGWEVRYGFDPVHVQLLMDHDEDGIPDLGEWYLGTSPVLADTDVDGMNDSWEERFGTNPVKLDSDEDPDADLLNNSMEHWAGTFPLRADSDGDGLQDGEEILVRPDVAGGFLRLTDPIGFDDDLDGMSDDEEYPYWLLHEGISNASSGTLLQLTRLAYRLQTADSDGDGILDGLEIKASATDPSLNDTDGDGTPDGEEIWTCYSNPHVRDGCTRLPVSPDRDEDGVPDAVEAAYWGPARIETDIDGDGLHNLDDADSDGDGVSDGLEILQIALPHEFFYHSSAARNDTDGDGLFDGEEDTNRLSPHQASCRREFDSSDEPRDARWEALWTRTEDGCWFVKGAWGIRLYAI